MSNKQKKPRVLIIGPVFPRGGGVGMVNSILLHSDLNENFEMLSLDTGRTKAGSGKETTLAPINFLYFFQQLWRLLVIMVTKRPKLIHQSVTYGPAFWKEHTFILIARLLGAKAVSHIHGSVLDVELRKSSPRKKRWMTRALSLSNSIIVLSEHWKQFLLTEVSPKLNVAIIANSIDHSIAGAMEDGTDFAAREKMVFFIGSLGTRKGVHDALRAVPLIKAEMPEMEFVFGGKVELGHEKEMIEELCRKATEEHGVQFPGLITGDTKLHYFKTASIFILPSYNENLPVSILEAMAMGLPVVSTPIAGVPEMMQDGINGFLIEPGDHEALADRIIKLMQDDDLRREIGERNVKNIQKNFHPRIFAQNVSQLYEDVLKTSVRYTVNETT